MKTKIKPCHSPKTFRSIIQFRVIVSLITLLSIQNAFTQTITQTILGKVVDNESQSPLIGVNVIVLGLNIGAATDVDGNFKISNVPLGRYTIQASYIGYSMASITEVLVTSAKAVELTIPMQQSVTEMKEVTVNAYSHKEKPLNPMATISARSFSVEETRRYAGGFDDPARMASAFAGVTVGNFYDNAITIRGNAPKGVSWRLEGIEIPNPNHFANGVVAGGGAFTAFSSQMLANSDFFTGAFPAEYGNALAGVFEMKFRTGNSEKREYTFQAGLLGIDLSSEGPIVTGKKATYLFNYRYSTFGLLSKMGFLKGMTQIPQFQDLSFKFNFPTQKMGTFSLWGLGAMDVVLQPNMSDSSKWKTETDRENYIWNLNFGVIGLTNKYRIDNQTLLSTTIASSGILNKMDGQRLDNALVQQPNWYRIDNSAKTSFNSTVTHKFNASNTLKIGINYNQLFYNYNMNSTIDNMPGTVMNFAKENGNTEYAELYAQSKYDIRYNITLNSGINASYFGLNNDYNIDPRIGIKWSINEKHSLSLGYGKHSQMEDLKIYLLHTNQNGSETLPNKELKLSHSQHFVLGYDWLLTDNLRLKIEPYFQYVYDAPGITDSSYSMINFKQDLNFRNALVNNSKGKNYGIDLTFERFMSNKFYFLYTVSLFDSKYKAGDNVWRNTRYNKNFAMNLLFGKEFFLSKNKILGMNGRFSFMGGERISPILIEKSLQNKVVIYDESKAFENQLPATKYLDFTVTYRINKVHHSSIWALQIKNMLGTATQDDAVYNSKSHTIVISKSVDIIPILSYKIEF
jgi:hypothetical protein